MEKGRRLSSHATATIIIMAIMGILVNYVETMITPALPILKADFNASYDSLSWIITAYVISGTVSAAIFGRLADMYGKKRIFMLLSLIYAIAVSFGGFATTLEEFIAIRAVQGLGMGMFPVAFALLNDQVPKEELPLAQGILSSTFTAGAALGLVLGAWITQTYEWEYSYHSAIPVAFGLLIASYLYLRDNSQRTKSTIDFLGISLISSGVVLLILGLSEGQSWGWYSLSIEITFIMSAILLFLFILVESRRSQPFISMKLMRIRNVFLSNFTGLFAMAAMFFLFYSVPPLLEDPSPAGFQLSIFNSGLTMLPAALASMIFAPVAAVVTKRLSPKLSIEIGSVVLFLSYIGLYYFRASPMEITEDATILGIGLSFIFVGMINILLVSTPAGDAGASTGMNVVFRNIGSAVAPAISGVFETMYEVKIITGVNSLGMPEYSLFPDHTAFSYIFLTGMAFLLVSIIFTLFMKVPGKENNPNNLRNTR